MMMQIAMIEAPSGSICSVRVTLHENGRPTHPPPQLGPSRRGEKTKAVSTVKTVQVVHIHSREQVIPVVFPQHVDLRALAPNGEAVHEQGEFRCYGVNHAQHMRRNSPSATQTAIMDGRCRLFTSSPLCVTNSWIDWTCISTCDTEPQIEALTIRMTLTDVMTLAKTVNEQATMRRGMPLTDVATTGTSQKQSQPGLR